MRATGDYIEPEKFSAMAYNPFAVPEDQYFVEYYPELRKHRKLYTPPLAAPGYPDYESWSREYVDDLVRVVVVVLDQDSPLSDSEDLEYRLRSALVSLSVQDAIVTREVLSRGAFFRKTVYEYFRISRNYDLEQWWSLKTLYHTFARLTQNPGSDLSKDQVSSLISMANEMEDLKKKIARISLLLFKDRESERLVTAERAEDVLAGEPELRADDLDPDMMTDEDLLA